MRGLLVWLWCSFAIAQTPADSAVHAILKKEDGSLPHTAIIRRTSLTENLDLVIAIASPAEWPIDTTQPDWFGLSEKRKLGLFLQERKQPDVVYRLAVASGFPDCFARIERVTMTDTVISCTGEKSEIHPHQKFIYDIRAKALVRQMSYMPFRMERINPQGEGAVFVATDSNRKVAVEYQPARDPLFQVTGSPVENSTSKAELSQSTYTELAQAWPENPQDVQPSAEIVSRIGPWQWEGDKLWFGKTFYAGEGYTGIGAFGYFDLATKSVRVFSPPEIERWSVSAIDVSGRDVWIALVHNGEYGGSSGGLLRFDRTSETVRKYTLPDIGSQFLRVGDRILLATDFGIALIEGDRVQRYFVDQTSDGRLRVVTATR